MSTNFRQEHIEPSAREVCIIFILVEREERGGECGMKREHGVNLAKVKTAPELNKNC